MKGWLCRGSTLPHKEGDFIMSDVTATYEELRQHRLQAFKNETFTSVTLNEYHDQLIRSVVEKVTHNVQAEKGKIQIPYAFFLMGSAGRFEQAYWSDQDHGLIYDESDDHVDAFFKQLGQEIPVALEKVGYPLCDGLVMSSNPRWRKSLADWEEQIREWVEQEDWQAIRYLLIFMDARLLVGQVSLVPKLKSIVFRMIDHYPSLMQRFLSNTMRVKQGVGVFGQFIVQSYGPYSNCVDLKHVGFFPYVNAIRLLAMKEKILASSTLERLDHLLEMPPYNEKLSKSRNYFAKLLEYRLNYQKVDGEHDATHYLPVDELNRKQRKELKQIIVHGRDLFGYVSSLIEKG